MQEWRWGWLGAALPLLLAAAAHADPADGSPPNLASVAGAVEGAESSWGRKPRMRRADPQGPQGPMQITAAAAADVGGGDRFDLQQNRALGRAYLGRMYSRFGSWGDAVAAYNWGPGRIDDWIRNGRPAAGLPFAVERYRERVLYGAPIAGEPTGSPGLRVARLRGIAHAQPTRRPGPPTAADREVAMLYTQVMSLSTAR